MNEEVCSPSLSKQISDRLSSGSQLLRTLCHIEPSLNDRLASLFGAWLEDPAAPPFAELLRAFHGRLHECHRRLAESSEHHLEAQIRADEAMCRSVDANDRLTDALSAMRATFRGVYGYAQLAHFGFSDRAPRRPRALLKASRALHHRLLDPELELPPSRVPGFDLDCLLLAGKIAPSIDQLDRTLTTADDHRERVEESERRQAETMVEYNDAFLNIARTLESWLRMAGLEDEADAVRPSRRRPGVLLDYRSNATPEANVRATSPTRT